MVTNVTSVSRNGVRDFLIQRITAIILAAFLFCLVGYSMRHSPMTFAAWHGFFANSVMRAFTFLALLSMVYHTWSGMWRVYSDYVKYPWLRLTIQVLTVAVLLGYLVWGIDIVWGI